MHCDVVLVNFRQPGLTEDCLLSLQQAREAGVDVLVWLCENGSGDQSPEYLKNMVNRHGWGDWVNLKINDSNEGFAGGNNCMIREAIRQPCEDPNNSFVFLLNNDTVVRPGALQCMLDFMLSHPNVAAAGSGLEDPDGTRQVSAFRFPTIWGELEAAICFGPVTKVLKRHVMAPPPRQTAHATDWVAGASLMVRRSILEKHGFLDEGFWTYFEDLDFCRRLHDSGNSIWYVPDARIVHLVGASSGVTSAEAWKRRRPAYWYEARRRYFLKHHRFAEALVIDAVEWLGSALGLLIRKLRGVPPHRPKAFLSDLWSGSAWRRGWDLPVVQGPAVQATAKRINSLKKSNGFAEIDQ